LKNHRKSSQKEFAPSITIENSFAVTSGEIPRLKEIFIGRE